jgi:endonuclease-3 related protein
MDGKRIDEILQHVYRRLLERYGPQHWWPAQEPFEVIAGAILTQSAAWTNVEKALTNLKAAGKLTPKTSRELPEAELATLIHSCGYYNVKARKLKAFVDWLGECYNDNLEKLFASDVDDLRERLLNIYGIGEETADSIILYAGNKPAFVIDAYTRRIIDRMGLSPSNQSYRGYQALFIANLPADTRLFNEYHALLVRHGKEFCRKQPICEGCCFKPEETANQKKPESEYPCAGINQRF